jgi:hypothetical protein
MLGPILGTISVLGILAGIVIIGTHLEDSHQRAQQEYKKRRFQEILDSGKPPDDIPNSINGEELEALRKVVWDEKKELALEHQRHHEKAGELEEEIIVKYYDVLEKIQEDHGRRRSEDVD